MLLYKLTETTTTKNLYIETHGYLSDDLKGITMSQHLFDGTEIVSTNEIYLPIKNFANLSRMVGEEYVKGIMDTYTIE